MCRIYKNVQSVAENPESTAPYLKLVTVSRELGIVKGYGIHRLRSCDFVGSSYEYASLLFCQISGVSESANSLSEGIDVSCKGPTDP